MAIKASAQKTLIDLTDGYSVILSNDNHTFAGTESSVNGTQSITCEVQAMCGAKQVSCEVGEIATPTGLSIVSNNAAPVPTLTITATSALMSSGSVIIPVVVGGDITINKVFSWSIAFKGTDGADGTSVTVASTSVTYLAGTSGTTPPTGTWSSVIPPVATGQYLWTKTVVEYSDGESTTAYSVSYKAGNGADGTSVTVESTEVSYQTGTSGTTPPTGTWSSTIPTVAAGGYLWTRTVVKYSDGTSTTSYSISRNGSDGADAITMVITSSNGDVFKNTAIATTLTAHVYKGGAEVTGASLTALGTIYWYKNDGTVSIASGTTLTINVGDVNDSANYTAQLEG